MRSAACEGAAVSRSRATNWSNARRCLTACVAAKLDALKIPPAPLDVLAQQIVAEVACREWDEDALYDWLRRAWPYARLPRETFDAVLRMLAEGYATRRGARAGLLHRDAVNRKLRGRQGARMTAVMSGGTIPDTADYAVVMEPQAINIGSVHEDFAVESLAGDVFQLGNASYRILRIEPGRLRVEDAQGAPPNIPSGRRGAGRRMSGRGRSRARGGEWRSARDIGGPRPRDTDLWARHGDR